MSALWSAEARETYDAFAASYDGFNHGYMYERWTGKLLERAEACGLAGHHLFDVGCGTGLSFLAMLERGFEVTGCDISPGMLAEARGRVDAEVDLHVADMRALPRLGEFDLVWAVNDAVNYLMDGAELQAALSGMRRNLGPGGIVLFDANTLMTYRGFFSEEVVVERDECRYVWHGLGAGSEAQGGSVFEARFEGEGPGVQAHMHRQRHFPESEVHAAIEGAGLRCLEVRGELDGELAAGFDEERHTKAVYVCGAARTSDACP